MGQLIVGKWRFLVFIEKWIKKSFLEKVKLVDIQMYLGADILMIAVKVNLRAAQGAFLARGLSVNGKVAMPPLCHSPSLLSPYFA